eukprot:TRINITY_DN96646_c0_g1_i1.p1 TRINITY_DN96646_c0_g1~~TRINITY_DN96646_c0_g1_i1.p1  ORF type:complete len:238 (+),score=37.26 TRINITY_DN96646_c0_g1_i1:37-714(+)
MPALLVFLVLSSLLGSYAQTCKITATLYSDANCGSSTPYSIIVQGAANTCLVNTALQWSAQFTTDCVVTIHGDNINCNASDALSLPLGNCVPDPNPDTSNTQGGVPFMAAKAAVTASSSSSDCTCTLANGGDASCNNPASSIDFTGKAGDCLTAEDTTSVLEPLNDCAGAALTGTAVCSEPIKLGYDNGACVSGTKVTCRTRSGAATLSVSVFVLFLSAGCLFFF